MEVMAVCGSWILCVGALLASPFRSELSILGCENGSVYAVEGTDQHFTCGEYRTTGPQWTVYGDEGRQLYSGSCNWWSCTPWNDQFRLRKVDHEKSYMFRSTLTIKNITRDSARQVVCSYSSTSVSCDLRIITLYIHDCTSGVRDVTEDTNVSFTCGQYTDKVEWSSLDGNDYGTMNYIGHCNGNGCRSPNESIFFLQDRAISENKYESTLYIRNLTRHQEFSLRCNEGNTTATCRLRVIAPPFFKKCDVYIKDWQVHATCVVEHMYSSDKRCTWRENNTELMSYFQDLPTEDLFNTSAYRQGVCYASQAMPYSPGNYTYSVKIEAGVWNTVKTLNIVPPGNPAHNCSEVVQEGSTVSCKCYSSNPGTPPAEFFWNERSNDILYFDKVPREENGKTYTCSMTWGPNRYTSRPAVLTLTVVVPVRIVPKTCKVQLSGWKVNGVCTIQWLDTISDIPNCLWRLSYQSSYWTTTDDLKGLLSSSIFFTVDSVRYKRRNCSFEQDMPVISGDYSYSIRVSSHSDDQFSESLRIVRPRQSTHNCPVNVYEGSSMKCKCMSWYAGSPPAEFLWDEVNNDTLHLQNIQRQDSGNNYTCRLRWGAISRTTVYNLIVITPVSNNPNSCSVQLSGWIVSGVCRVQWLPSEQERTCNWILKTKEKSEKIPRVQSTASYEPTDHVYYINCSFVRLIPAITENYTYSIDASSHPADKFSKSIFIEKPDPPQHNCSKMLLEGSNMACTCFTSNLGNPPAQIGWAESSKEHLAIEDIKRERNGTITTCSLTWGSINYTTPYMILVAFGPSVAYISSSSEETSGDETKTVLVCTTRDVYPSALFRWNILCENATKNETTSRCTLPTSPVADQTTIECTASNPIFTQVSSTTKYVLKPTHNPNQGGVIAGSVVAVLLLVVIVAVIILFIKRRKAINKPETQTPTVRFAAPSGDIYTIAGTTTGDHREDEYVTVRDTTCPNSILQPQTPVVRFAAPSGDLYSIAGPATAREVNEATMEGATGRMQHILPCHPTKNTTYNNNQGTESKKMPIKPTRLGGKNRHHWSSKAEFDNKVDTQRPAEHFAAPSGDLYAIAGPATAGEDKPMTEATSNTSYAPKSSSGHKARDIANMTNKGMDSKKMAIKPKPTRFGKQSRQDVPVTGYMNVTQVPTDSGLGVYHVPWAAMSETGSSDARVLDTSNISEDEYNVLRFQEDHTRQEDHDVTYSHLNIK